jgi:hypothetical protein
MIKVECFEVDSIPLKDIPTVFKDFNIEAKRILGPKKYEKYNHIFYKEFSKVPLNVVIDDYILLKIAIISFNNTIAI